MERPLGHGLLVLTRLRRRNWTTRAQDARTWKHGDYWPVFEQHPDDPGQVRLSGFAFVCPYEVIEGKLHRHWWVVGGDAIPEKFIVEGSLESGLRLIQSPWFDSPLDACQFVGRVVDGAWEWVE